MRQRVFELAKNPLISGSILTFVGSQAANLFHFIFNIFINNNLSKADYGTWASIVSLIMLPAYAVSAIQPIVVNFAASYFANNEHDKVKGLFYKIAKVFVPTGILVIVLCTLFASYIGQFFKIESNELIILASFIIGISFFQIINIAFLQAKLAFTYLAFVNLLGAVLKFIFGSVFLLLGFKVTGAVIALLLSSFIPYLLSFLPIKFIFDRNVGRVKTNTKHFIYYGIPAALSIFSLASLVSIDVILAKRFFTPEIAGSYAGLSLLGKIIYLFVMPVVGVMFPIIVQRHSKKENYHSILFITLALVLSATFFLTLIYYLFPQLVILILRQGEYVDIIPLTGHFGVFSSLYSLVYTLSFFYLSIQKTKIFLPLTIGAFMQAILIWYYHSSMLSIIVISGVITFLLLLILLLYYPYATRK